MNKILSFALSFLMAFALINPVELQAKTISLEVPDESKKMIKVQIPFDPKRIVCLNHNTVDILDQLGLGDRIVGMVKGSSPAHLKKYVDNKKIVNLGTMKELNMEAIMNLEPDIIFSSDRTVANYKEFIRIAPTVASFIEYNNGFYQGFKDNAVQHAKIFGKESEVNKIIADYDKRIATIKAKANNQTALLGIFSGGSLRALGDIGRASIVTTDMGFNNLSKDINVNHGNTASYELLLEKNPAYIFILDRDTAIGAKGAGAKSLLDNELVRQTNAYKNNRIVFLEPSDTWYVADGGIKSLDIIISNIEKALEIKK